MPISQASIRDFLKSGQLVYHPANEMPLCNFLELYGKHNQESRPLLTEDFKQLIAEAGIICRDDRIYGASPACKIIPPLIL